MVLSEKNVSRINSPKSPCRRIRIEERLMYKFDGRVSYAIGAPVMSGWGDGALR